MTEPIVDLKRVNRGKGHSYYINGVKADGVTTLIGDGIPKPALINWAANTTAGYAVDHWDTLADMPLSKRLDTLKRARWNDLDEAGKRGTEVHAIAEQLTHGKEVEIPENLAGHIDSAVKFLDQWRPEPILTEAVVANQRYMYCGTLDGIYRLPDGRVVISDFKTTRSGIFGEVALQLSAYAHADVYLDAEGAMQSVAELGITDGMAVWIRADGFDVYPVDISDDTFKTFLHAATVARRTRDLRSLIGEAMDVPA